MGRPVALLLLLALQLTAAPESHARKTAISAPAERHLVLLEAARDLVRHVGDRVWPGWGTEGFELLLVDGEREHLIGRQRIPAGFEPPGLEPERGGLAADVSSRDRVFPPGMLATMAPFGLPATIVIGTPEATGLRSAEWILVLLHEHFHQWQMRDAAYFTETNALDLAAGDTTGRWMLEYAFPYENEEVGAELEELSRRLALVLRQPADVDVAEAAGELWLRWRRLLAMLQPADARYAQFQVWQEGVARFVELRLAEEAAAGWTPPSELVARPDFEDLAVAACAAWERLYEHLETPDLAGRRRVSFYALGAGMALLLDRTEPDWKSRYERPRFALGAAAVD